MASHSSPLVRRQLLKTMALGGPGMAFAMSTPATHVGEAPNHQRNNHYDNLRADSANAYRLLLSLRYGTSGANTYWWLQGRRYASIDNELVPLFDIWVGFAYRRSTLSEGVEEIRSRSRVLYTELDSGELLSQWLNPISGRSVEFNYADPVTQTHQYLLATGLVRETQFKTSFQERSDTITGVRKTGGHIFLDEEARVRIYDRLNPDRPPRKVHDRYMWSGRLSINQSTDPIEQTSFSAGEVSFMDVTDWSPRLGMGEIAGCAIAHCSGHRAATLAEFPEPWHALHTRHALKSLDFDEP